MMACMLKFGFANESGAALRISWTDFNPKNTYPFNIPLRGRVHLLW